MKSIQNYGELKQKIDGLSNELVDQLFEQAPMLAQAMSKDAMKQQILESTTEENLLKTMQNMTSPLALNGKTIMTGSQEEYKNEQGMKMKRMYFVNGKNVTTNGSMNMSKDELKAMIIEKVEKLVPDQAELIKQNIDAELKRIEDDDKTANLYDDAFGFTEEMVDRDYAYAKQYATYNGELKGVTWQSTAGSVFYNKAIAKEVFGADDPETVQAKLADWDTFFKTAEELKAKGYKITNGPDEIYYAIINAHKDPWVVVADDGTETLKLDDSVKTFIENYKKLYDGEYTNGGTMWDNDWAGNQKDGGNVLCYFACPWMIGVMQGNGASNGSFGAVVGPQAYYWGGTYVSIGKDTPNPALAAFICYELACDDDMGVKITNKTGDAVANKKANERLVNGEIAEDNNGVAFLGGQNPYATWAAAGENIDQSACTYFDKNYEVMIKAAAQGYATGTYATVDDALNYIYSQSETELGISKAK